MQIEIILIILIMIFLIVEVLSYIIIFTVNYTKHPKLTKSALFFAITFWSITIIGIPIAIAFYLAYNFNKETQIMFQEFDLYRKRSDS